MGLSNSVRRDWYEEQVKWGKSAADFIEAHGAVIEMMTETKDEAQTERLAAAAEITWEQLSDFLEEQEARGGPYKPSTAPKAETKGSAVNQEADDEGLLSLHEIAERVLADKERVGAALALMVPLSESLIGEDGRNAWLIRRVLTDLLEAPEYWEDVEEWARRYDKATRRA